MTPTERERTAILIVKIIGIIVSWAFFAIAAFTINGRQWDQIPQDSRVIIIMGYVTFATIQMLIMAYKWSNLTTLKFSTRKKIIKNNQVNLN